MLQQQRQELIDELNRAWLADRGHMRKSSAPFCEDGDSDRIHAVIPEVFFSELKAYMEICDKYGVAMFVSGLLEKWDVELVIHEI